MSGGWKREPRISQEALDSIKRRVGPERYERLLETARRVFGNLEPEDLEEMEEIFGSYGLIEAALQLAENYGEPLPREAVVNAMFSLTRLQERTGDPAFMQRYLDGDPAAAAEMATLHANAFPEPPQPMTPVHTVAPVPDLSVAPAGAAPEPEVPGGNS